MNNANPARGLDTFSPTAPLRGPERRRHKRLRTDKSYFVGCTSLDPDVPCDGENLAVKLLDVSARGACVVSRARLRPGLRVRILVVRPGSGTRASVDATVRWSESLRCEQRVAHVTGIEFDRATPGLGLPDASPRPASKTAPSSREPRRHHRRFKPAKITLLCVPREGFLRKLGLRSNAAQRLVDLSQGGAQIVCTRRLKAGQIVDLKILLDDGQSAIAAEARVGWCRRDTLSLKPRWNVGLRFGPLDPDSKRTLMELQQISPR